MAQKSRREETTNPRSRKVDSQDFLQPWKFSDVVLVVEEERLHVHRAVLAMWSPVFEKMFESEFQEKDRNEIPLPGKKMSEVKELLLMIYPSDPSTAEKQITKENCHFLVKLAHEYQMDAIVRRCEDFMVENLKRKPNDGVIAELVFAQTYTLEKLREESVRRANNLTLKELKKSEMYDQVEAENLKEVMEGMITRLQRELGDCQHTSQQRQEKINAVTRRNGTVKSESLQKVYYIAMSLVQHASKKPNYSYVGCSDTKSYIAALEKDSAYRCKCGTFVCGNFCEASAYLQSLKWSLESLDIS